MRLENKLNDLVKSGSIKYYEIEQNESEPNSGMREYETMLIVFPNGESIKFSIFCSGCSENTCFVLSDD